MIQKIPVYRARDIGNMLEFLTRQAVQKPFSTRRDFVALEHLGYVERV
jgi:hypothetical protein